MNVMEIDELRRLFRYDAGTGRIFWRIKPNHNALAGSEAGSFINGYRTIGFRGKHYLSHRVAWALTYGCWPVHSIDHIDGVKDNNRIANLRDVPHSVNTQNLRHAPRKSRSQLIGAHWHSFYKTWTSQIRANGKVKFLGTFASPQLAHEAYVTAKRKLHEGCTI